MQTLVVLLAFVCLLIGVNGEYHKYCFRCAANPECNPPDPEVVNSQSPNVYMAICGGVCYDRRITHKAYGQTLVYRGCYERETDCVPGCFSNEEHTDCVKCCNKNMCNSARAVTFSLPVMLLAVTLARIVFQ